MEGEKRLGIFTGKYWAPMVGPVLIARDKLKGRPIVGASKEIKNEALALTVVGTYITYQALATGGVVVGVIGGIAKLVA